MNYRASWDNPGNYSFSGNLEDTQAVLAFVRNLEIKRNSILMKNKLFSQGIEYERTGVCDDGCSRKNLAGVAIFFAVSMGEKVVIADKCEDIVVWMVHNFE